MSTFYNGGVSFGGHVQELRHVVKLANGRVRWNADNTMTVTFGKKLMRLKTDEEVTFATASIRARIERGAP